jgi:hypothetical protein
MANESLSFVLSATQRRPIKGIVLTDPLILPPFYNGDVITGKIVCVTETGDVTSPTAALAVNGSSGIVLSVDGVVVAAATNITVANTNEISFDLTLSSAELTAALVGLSYVNATFEVRATIGTQDVVLCQEPVVIRQSARTSLPDPTPPLAPFVSYDYTITALRGAGSTIENVATLYLATGTLLLTNIGGATQGWTLTAGAADGTDPTGQVAPVDYSGSNARYWAKSLGL